MAIRARIAALSCGLLLATGCSSSVTQAPKEGPSPATTSALTGDPQVLKDVIDASFTVPGRSQLRRIRVERFVRGWGIERCGGKAPPLDGTADRFEQGLYPDLELIRRKGLSEPVEKIEYGRDDCQVGDEIGKRMSAFWDWAKLAIPWDEVTQTLLQDESLLPVKATMATCLRDRTGLEVSDEDPAISYLGSVNKAVVEDQSQDKMMEYSVPFADCGEDYYASLRRLLEKKRPALIERHREVLEKFAAELVDLGYVP